MNEFFGINSVCLMKATMTEVLIALRISKEKIKLLVQGTEAGRKELEEPETESCCMLS